MNSLQLEKLSQGTPEATVSITKVSQFFFYLHRQLGDTLILFSHWRSNLNEETNGVATCPGYTPPPPHHLAMLSGYSGTIKNAPYRSHIVWFTTFSWRKRCLILIAFMTRWAKTITCMLLTSGLWKTSAKGAWDVCLREEIWSAWGQLKPTTPCCCCVATSWLFFLFLFFF